MLQLFFKNKIAVIMCVVIVGLTALMLGMGISYGKEAKQKFPAEGYVQEVVVDDNRNASVVQNAFLADTVMKKNASDYISFVNTEGQNVSVHKDTFLHYADGSISSVEGMLMTELSEFSKGMINSFYIDGMLNLQHAKGAYTIQNNTETMKFEEFLLKTGKNHYLLVGPKFELDINEKKVEVTSGMLELCYQDEEALVVSATDGTDSWQFLTKGNSIAIGDDVVLNLEDAEIHTTIYDTETGEYVASIELFNLPVSPENAIAIYQDEWQAPTFVITTEDGEDGKGGEEGEKGEDGEDGDEGEEGEEGEKGKDGIAGPSGKKGSTGDRGLPGKDGEYSDEEEYEGLPLPSVNITSWEQTAGTVDFKLTAYNTALIKEETTEAYIMNVATGAVDGIWAQGMELKEYEGDESSWRIDSLQPNTEYKLVISAMVLRTEGEETKYAKTILLSRTFSTDENGFYLKKVQADYITEENIADYGDKAVAGTACLGLQAKLSGKQKLAEVTSVQISYRDKETGVLIEVTGSDNPFNNPSECEALRETAETGNVYYLHNLKSNTEYTITANVVLENGNISQVTDTYLTLKATPIVTQAMFDVNANRFFISSAQLYKDEDQAIESYAHEIYRYYSGTGMTGECLKKKTGTETEVYIYLSEMIRDGQDELGVTYEYGNKIYVTWFDNEKYVTKEVPQSDAWKSQHIADSAESYIEFHEAEPDGITSTQIVGELVVHSGSGQTIYVGDKDVHRILVQITSSGFTKVLYYSDLTEWLDDNGDPMSGTTIHGKARLPIRLEGLAPGTTYVVTVSAYFDETTSESANVGSTVIKTLEN